MAQYIAIADSTGIVIEAVNKKIRHRDRHRIIPISYYCEDLFQLHYELLLAGHFSSRCRASHNKLAQIMTKALESKDYELFLTTLNKIKKKYGVSRLTDFYNICKNCGAKS